MQIKALITKTCLTAALCLILNTAQAEPSDLTTVPIFYQNYQFQKGVDYEELKNPLNLTGREMREFFSFYCPHCRHAQKAIRQLAKSLPEGMKLVLNPVPWMGPAEASEATQLALAAALDADQEEIYMQKQFAAIFDDKQIPSTFEEVSILFEEATKLDPKLLQDQNLRLQKDQWNAISETFDIQFVPCLVINGRYELNIALLDDLNRAAALISYLNTLESAD